VSIGTSNAEEFDVEKAVADALEESLGLCGNDPDIIEAKKRLLASKVLSPSHFDVGEGNENFTFSSSDEDYEVDDSMTNEAADGDVLASPAARKSERGGEEEEKEEVPTETTPLRPSIFTTVASIAEREEMDAQLSNSRHSRADESDDGSVGEGVKRDKP